MELTHHFEVPASIDDTWHRFNDLEAIIPCFPGATLSSVEGDEFHGSVKVKLGPISMVYKGSGTFVERDADAYRVVIEGTGKDRRGNGNAGVTVTAAMSETEEGTAVDVTTDMNITGKPAQFGRGVIQSISDKLLNRFLDCIKEQMAEA